MAALHRQSGTPQSIICPQLIVRKLYDKFFQQAAQAGDVVLIALN